MSGLAAVAHEDDALHDVGVVILAHDAQPRRVPIQTLARSRTRTGTPLLLEDHDVADVLEGRDEPDAPDIVALLAHG